jgi:hypothetical protein
MKELFWVYLYHNYIFNFIERIVKLKSAKEQSEKDAKAYRETLEKSYQQEVAKVWIFDIYHK